MDLNGDRETRYIFFQSTFKNSLKNTHKQNRILFQLITSKFGWDLDKKSWKPKCKISKQVRVVLEKFAVRLEKCPISEMKTAVIKLKRLAMPNLKGWVKPKCFLIFFLARSWAWTLLKTFKYSRFSTAHNDYI